MKATEQYQISIINQNGSRINDVEEITTIHWVKVGDVQVNLPPDTLTRQ